MLPHFNGYVNLLARPLLLLRDNVAVDCYEKMSQS